MYTIYCAYCEPSSKIYVGQTSETIQKRWGRHCLRASYGEKTYLWNAIRKYGNGSFVVSQLAQVETKEEADNLERMWILLLNANNKQFGYNLTSGGEGTKGLSAESRHRIRLSRLGKKASPETLQKMSAARRGIPTWSRKDVSTSEIVRMYQEGKSCHDIGKILNCNWATVRNRLIKSGVARRAAHRHKESCVGITG